MLRTASFPATPDFPNKLCLWLETQDVGMCFRGNGWQKDGDVLAGFGSIKSFEGEEIHQLSAFLDKTKEIVFCHINYDLKNQLEALHSENPDPIKFPLFKFFAPEVVVELKGENVFFKYHDQHTSEEEISAYYKAINTASSSFVSSGNQEVTHRISKTQYLNDVAELKNHIQLGDIYQANYCQEFYWENLSVCSSELFNEGFEAMKNPFSVYYKNGDKAVASFSPERFIKVNGRQIMSQPMKGTATRSSNPDVDAANKKALRDSEKERRENVMIVDLVRNDLSHFAAKGSVKVPELYKIESYSRVHQMYSTVTAELKSETPIISALLSAFPMGSMTGAPKVRAMQILEGLEKSKRGIYSGTLGFFLPDGRADFNVVIRSLIYNSKDRYLSCHAGGGITDLSDPQEEYEECMVKVMPLLELVKNHLSNSVPASLPLKDENTAS